MALPFFKDTIEKGEVQIVVNLLAATFYNSALLALADTQGCTCNMVPPFLSLVSLWFTHIFCAVSTCSKMADNLELANKLWEYREVVSNCYLTAVY
jgi:hypothetical protein